MKSVYSSLVALVVFVVLAPLAIADPGTTWEIKINGPDRFQVLSAFGGAAVLDQETGRVWEQSPSTSQFTWDDAISQCYRLEVDGRRGWRLPTIEELASLVDTSHPPPTLPAGNPFSNVQSFVYWSATTVTLNTSVAWNVNFENNQVSVGAKSIPLFVWCVRGGQGIVGVQ
jgi:hypothetical protein